MTYHSLCACLPHCRRADPTFSRPFPPSQRIHLLQPAGGGAPPAATGAGAGAGAGVSSAAPTSPWEASRRQEETHSAADFLLRERYLLTALELHQELMERAGGMHDVQALNAFFADPTKVDAVVAQESASNPAISAALPALSAVPSPFDPYSTHGALEERDQQLALLQYKLRIADEDKETLQQQLEDASADSAALAAGSSRRASIVSAAVAPSVAAAGVAAGADASGVAPGGEDGAGDDEEPEISVCVCVFCVRARAVHFCAHALCGPVHSHVRVLSITQDHERRTLNVLVKQYLMDTGCKLTAVTLAEEVSGQDLDDLAAVGLRGRTTSLLEVFRDRVAPLEHADEAKKSLEDATRKVQQLEQAVHDRDAQIAKLKDAVETAENKTSSALRAKQAALASLATLTEAVDEPEDYQAGRVQHGGAGDDTPRDLAGELVSVRGCVNRVQRSLSARLSTANLTVWLSCRRSLAQNCRLCHKSSSPSNASNCCRCLRRPSRRTPRRTSAGPLCRPC